MALATLSTIVAMLGVSALDDIFKGDRGTVTSRITKLATILRNQNQAEVDRIYDQILALPGASAYSGAVKDAMLKTHQKLSDKYKQAKEKQSRDDAAITVAENNAANYENQSGIGGLFNTNPEKRAKASAAELENLLKVENKA